MELQYMDIKFIKTPIITCQVRYPNFIYKSALIFQLLEDKIV